MNATKKLMAVTAALALGFSAWGQEKLNDSLSKIYDVNQRKADVKEEYETAFQDANAKLNAEVQAEFAKISQMEQYGWESADEYNARISAAIESVTAKRYADIERVNNEIRANYDSKLTVLENEKQTLINELLDKEFVYSGDSVELTFSSFDRSEKYFPFTVKSVEPDLNYVSSGLKYFLSKDKIADEWPVIDGYIKDDSLSAQIYFSVAKKPSSELYQKKVTMVKLVKRDDGLVLGTYNVNEVVEVISMDEAIASSSTPAAKPAPKSVAPVNEPEVADTDEPEEEEDESDVDAPVIEAE